MNTIGTLRALDETRGAVRVEDVFDTGIEDLWQACTTPERLARWIAQVDGDLRVGGDIQVVFTSTWTGPARIEVCDSPQHLLTPCSQAPRMSASWRAWLTEEGPKTRLVVEERGLPRSSLYLHGAGWQAHLEDLGQSLTTGASAHPDGWSSSRQSPAWQHRWDELSPTYRDMTLERGVTTMRDPNAYPELILASAQERIQALERKQARDEAIRTAKGAGRRSRSGTWSWWRSRVTRSPAPGD